MRSYILHSFLAFNYGVCCMAFLKTCQSNLQISNKEDDVPMIEIENILRQDPGLSTSVLRFMMLDHFSMFFCSRRCELKFTGQELSIELQKIVYPEMYKI